MIGRHRLLVGVFVASSLVISSSAALALTSQIAGTVHDETGGALPGVAVDARHADGVTRRTTTDSQGIYRLDGFGPGPVELAFTLLNFAPAKRTITVAASRTQRLDVVLHLSLSADVTVTGKRTFTNLADAEDPAQNLIGIAQSASQGAITGKQLDARPIMRTGEVLETVPGVVISQHSGEGKANQYFLRGFNLDHGTDFATMVAGMPVNMPTHAHGHGYSDLNFLIPELVSGVQFSKGPYFADQGDFATAGAANINYTNALSATIVRVGAGKEGYGRVLAAASPLVGRGRLLVAFELEHNDGPWVQPDDYRKINGVIRYTQGDAVNGFSVSGMGYHGKWNSTDQVPQRAVLEGLIDRLGAVDTTDGGDTYRYSGSFEWQRTRDNGATKLAAYGIAYDLNLFSNFAFFLSDPVNGDQIHQADHRFVSGFKLSHRHLSRWAERSLQTTVGVQVRNDDISTLGLYHTKARQLLDTVRHDAVLQTSGAVYAQNEIAWTPWLRTLAGARADLYRFRVAAGDPANGGTNRAGLVNPKGGAIFGPWSGTELYVDAGLGFHSNDARSATITRDLRIAAVDRVTPLARAKGAEFGVRTVAVPHLQSSVTAWTLSLASELVFVGDAGTTEAGRPSHRYGVEWANYYAPRPWLTFDGDLAVSRGRFRDQGPAGDRIPGAAETVISAGATVDAVHNVFASFRLRYFGPRPLVEDNSVRSRATRLANAEIGYAVTTSLRVALDVFNVFDAKDSDIDYFYRSRLRGEPLGGIDDIHFHATLPRTARLNFIVGF